MCLMAGLMAGPLYKGQGTRMFLGTTFTNTRGSCYCPERGATSSLMNVKRNYVLALIVLIDRLRKHTTQSEFPKSCHLMTP